MNAECRLCQSQEELRNSHVLPEFLYESLYDEKHRFKAIHMDGSESPSSRLEQKGYRERLLCQKCETKLSRLEGYASKNYFVAPDRVNLGMAGLERPYGFEYRGLEYETMKLFQLSLLWRISVATIKPFSGVSVGQEHEERLRNILLTENAPAVEAYPCFISEDPAIPRGELWGSPLTHTESSNGTQIVTIFVDNQFWQFEVAERANTSGPGASIAKTWLAPDGIIMGYWRNLKETPFYEQLAQEQSQWSDEFKAKLGLP